LSTNTMSAVDSAFNTLAQTVLVQNSRTLEDLVREMMRPMLKTWLDDNLPGLVERLVRADGFVCARARARRPPARHACGERARPRLYRDHGDDGADLCVTSPNIVVMPGLVPGIHAFAHLAVRRGWPGQARP